MLKKFITTITIILLIIWISGYILFVINIITKTPTTKDLKADAIIVLTGGNNRINTGLKLWKDGFSKNIFITGAHPSVSNNDIINMWKTPKDLPKCCLTLGHEATTTKENALEANTWIKNNNIHNIILITSNYHMDRALLEFKHIIKNIDITVYVVPEKNNPLKSRNFWKRSFSEYHKFILRKIIITLSENTK